MSAKARVFDLSAMGARPYEERDRNVFYAADAFKARIIELGPGGEMPLCRMESHVVFVIIDGEVTVRADGEDFALDQGKCLITPPAELSMRSDSGVRMMGLQIQGQPA